MWETIYQDRLAAWHQLRQQAATVPTEQALLLINDWWLQAPMVNRSIAWDDQQHWPDPWNLLTQSGYCELAKALGIVYTILMTEHVDHTSLNITQTDRDNLVLIDNGKYILNWAPGEMLNIHSTPITTVKNTIDSSDLASFLQ
jgi:hypothetical protein